MPGLFESSATCFSCRDNADSTRVQLARQFCWLHIIYIVIMSEEVVENTMTKAGPFVNPPLPTAVDQHESNTRYSVFDEERAYKPNMILLRARGTCIAQVLPSDFELVYKYPYRGSSNGVTLKTENTAPLKIQTYDFQFEEGVVRFMAIWTWTRDTRKSIDHVVRLSGDEWHETFFRIYASLVGEGNFSSLITSSLKSCIIEWLRQEMAQSSDPRELLDTVYKFYRYHPRPDHRNELDMVFATIYIHRETDHNEWEESGLISRMTDIFTTRLLRDAWIRGDWSRIPKDPLTLPLKQCCGRFHFDRRPEECRERRNLVRTVIPEKFFYFRLS
ncbi:hypothetical protein D6C99_08378 [Aureobasidium pullulans]|nr:hypothetical protein D6C99_08378 [Aureobasidium pullulans]